MKHDGGFTLLEVIAVLVVIGIIVAVAISRISFSGNELYVERDLLKTNLRYVQLRALTNNSDTNTTWGISFSGSSYTLFTNGTATNVYFPADQSVTHTMQGGVTVTAPASVTYDYWGSPVGSNTAVTLGQSGKTESFTITGNTGHIQ
jgi:prepilin-type N-terminal cleavage/methylation domain-containing protein